MNKEETEYPIEEELEEYMQMCKQLQQENQQLKEMIDEQDGCNKRRLQIFDLKDKLCKELKNVKNLKEQLEKKNKIIEEIKNIIFLDRYSDEILQYLFEYFEELEKEINNMNIEIIEEPKKIETLPILKDDELFKTHLAINQTRRKLNEIIDYLMENK